MTGPVVRAGAADWRQSPVAASAGRKRGSSPRREDPSVGTLGVDKTQPSRRRRKRRLADEGWCLVVVWEHEDPVDAADRVEQALAAGIQKA